MLLTQLLNLPLASLAAAGWREKVDRSVLAELDAGRRADAILWLTTQADLTSADQARSRRARGRRVFEALTGTAGRTQAALLVELKRRQAEHRAYWVANMIHVRGDAELIRALAERPEVAGVHANPRVAMPLPVGRAVEDVAAIEPGLTQLLVPQVFWSAGVTGEGIVVAHADSGVDWDHPALLRQYRGWDGVTAVHDYSWHDAIHEGGGSCGADSPEPCDDTDHGTPTMGVLVGDDGGGNQIGVAPGARWISCRNMDQGVGTPVTYVECLEFFLAPTDASGGNPDPDLAPHVVSNSWRCPPEEGCTDPKILQTVVDNLRAAGITVVASAGNDGASCETVNAPPAIYPSVWTVGAVNIFGEAEAFSSRGPVTVDGSARLKPDFLAPGRDIRTSARDGGFLSYSGTSLSAPHVAGLAALMMSAQRCLMGDVDAMERRLKETTRAFTTSETCGDTDGISPNNTYGWGIAQATFPEAADCRPAPGGTTEGLVLTSFVCRNQTTGGSVTVGDARASSWDCVDAGLGITAGDRIAHNLRGKAIAGEVSGTLKGVVGGRGTCRNRSTGAGVAVLVEPGGFWSCTAAGMDATPDDRVEVALRGVAN